MSIFKPLSNKSVKEVEESISTKWEKMDLLQKTIDNRKDQENFVFYEGPPTANGKPGIHHVLARTLKDTVCKYHSMKGRRVVRKAGWDTHGLPVEIEVEKILNISSKPEIEAYGIAEFNEMCKQSVFSYEKLWREMSNRMGYLIDMDDPYITLDNDYIESVWWILNKFFKEDFIYEGHKILPYCPRCGTGLASHEVAQGYQEDQSNTIIVAFERKDVKEYFLAWTTTPWTLAANVALAVHPEAIYARVKSEGEIYICAADLVPELLGEDAEVIETFEGKTLEGIHYHQLMPFVPKPPNKDAFYVVCADYVTIDEGTGLVHTAPAFGEDDYKTGKQYDLPVLQPVDESGKYTDTPWKGRFVMEDGLDLDIIQWLRDEGKLFKKEKVVHNYPHCWRCKTPLLYYAKPSWYIEMTKIKDKLIANNNGVNWFPDFVGEKRFGNWLENLNDWAISRSRYWGTPLNIWRCDNPNCEHLESIASRKELKERAIEDIDENIELHRPYVDDVHLTCPKCQSRMTRVEDVIDCWFDSGSMPFAQYHYPFENKDTFEDQFPADFVCEGIDQTRGWFYSLIAISTFVTGLSPYKNVLVNDLILDAKGQKMSKSRGNTVDPFEMFDRFGADALRWYLLHVSPVWSPTRFDTEGIREIQSKFFNTLKNTYAFFVLYANTDEIDPRSFNVTYQDRPFIDRWILSKLNHLVQTVRSEMDQYDLTKSVRAIQSFINEDLSNWYIRVNRRRFWNSELNDDKKAVFNTTYEVLHVLARLCAPFAPFISEELYTALTGEDSVHLSDFPEVDESLLDDAIEGPMDMVRDLVSLGRSAREDAQIKVRQPIGKIILDQKNKDYLGDLTGLILDELNVKEIEFDADLKEFIDYQIKPNFKVAGPALGKNVKLLGKALAQADAAKMIQDLEDEGFTEIEVDGNVLKLTPDFLDVRIQSQKGFNVQTANNLFVILDTTLNEELLQEGYAREFISKIQQMRKTAGLEMMDRIEICYNTDETVEAAINTHQDFIMKECLANSVEKTDRTLEVSDLNGHDTGIGIVKA